VPGETTATVPSHFIPESSSTVLIEPLQEFSAAAVAAAANGNVDDFEEALCPCCMCSLFEFKSDGSILVLARQLKCVGTGRQQYPHIVHTKCAWRWFIDKGATTCPVCREDFRQHLCIYIEAALEYRVESGGGPVQWSSSPDRRLAALNALLQQFPEQTAIVRQSTSSAVIHSVLDAPTPEIFDAAMKIVQKYGGALISQRPISSLVHSACAALVAALAQDDGSGRCEGCMDSRRGAVAFAISQLTRNDMAHVARSVLIESGACRALIHAFSFAVSDHTRTDIAMALGFLSQCELGIQASNFELQALFFSSATDSTQRHNVAQMMHIVMLMSTVLNALHEHYNTHQAYAALHELFSSHAVHTMHFQLSDHAALHEFFSSLAGHTMHFELSDHTTHFDV